MLTAKNSTPSRDWINPDLGYLHSSKARNRVKQWFKQLDYEHHVEWRGPIEMYTLVSARQKTHFFREPVLPRLVISGLIINTGAI
ncbi:MAG: hypothetical protein KZQ71_06020, partial [Candidatus Thiodiazotropha sp. (ex Lucinoma aequizonata)]|nr:hypothetical protein [Candidatus Thiodiazotropha sp. (ex Lucinoma aequizonata)]